MALIGIYDWDFFHYKQCYPNLECGKLLAYYRKNNDIAVLTDKLEPSRYTKFYIRKDYEDGIYLPIMREPNVELGGLAFSKIYKPLPEAIENTAPVFDDYSKYEKYFVYRHTDYKRLKRFLNGAHCRLSLDGKTINPNYRLQLQNKLLKTQTIFIHDTNLFQIENSVNELKKSELIEYSSKVSRRYYLKFMQHIDSPNQLYDALSLLYANEGMAIQYDGFIPDTIIYDLAQNHPNFLEKIVYNPILWYNDFENQVSHLLRQLLFLHNDAISFSLICDSINICEKDRNIIVLLNRFLHCTRNDYFKNSSVISTIKTSNHYHNLKVLKIKYDLTLDEIRDIVRYTGENYYDLFVQFYERNKVFFKNGEFVYD